MFRWQKRFDNLCHRYSWISGYLPARRIGLGREVRMVRGTFRPPYSCQVYPVDHCNLTCLDCNHASPVLPRRFADPRQILEDFRKLFPVYRCRTITLLGGEPLLHPELPAIIANLRKTKVSRYISLVTNGILLDRISDETLDALNLIEISRYPGGGLTTEGLAAFRKRAGEFQTEVRVYRYERFRMTFASLGTADDALVGRVFRACKIANLWGCHVIHDGYLYKCPQGGYVPRIPGCAATHAAEEDGLRLGSGPEFGAALEGFFSSEEPLKACRYCAGTVGRDREHGFCTPSAWAAEHHRPLEEIIDFQKLQACEEGREEGPAERILEA